MAKAAARTGSGPTAMVVGEQYFPKQQRILDDPLAARMILPAAMRPLLNLLRVDAVRDWMIRSIDKSYPGLWSVMMCRKRYIDEKLAEAMPQMEAMVNLGAGFDTRAYRLPALASAPVWEVDQPENIRTKEARVRKIFGAIPSHVKLVATDFDRESLDSVLAAHGYSLDRRTFFVWEGVSQYLTESGIRATFDFFSRAASGSRIAFTYVRRDFLSGKNMYGWENSYQRFVAREKIWLFGMNPEEWPDFLSRYGLRVVADLGFDELAEKYVKPTGRTLASTPVERIIYAEKF